MVLFITGNEQVRGDRSPSARITSAANLSSRFIIQLGVIQELLPLNRAYKVALDKGPIITCTYMGESGFSLFSVKAQTILPVGAVVFVLRERGYKYGYIIGVVPDFVVNTGDQLPDELVQGANSYISNYFYNYILWFQPSDGGGIPYWEGSHLDAVPGDWVRMTDTGLSIFLSPFLGGIRANEYCGLWVHFPDSLLRVAGFNYQKWTGGSEDFVYIDKSIVWNYSGYALLLDEQLGARKGRIIGAARPFTTVYNPEDPRSRVTELEHKTVIYGDQGELSRFPQHKVQEWKGALGGGGLKYVLAPGPSGWPLPKAEFGITGGGMIIGQSASGIIFAKYPYVTMPFRAAEPDEKLGEIDVYTSEAKVGNLIASFGSGNYIDYTRLDGAKINLFDIHNFIFNWDAKAGFYIYPKKFKFHRELDGYFQTQKTIKLSGERSEDKTAYFYIDRFGNIVLQNGNGARIELIDDRIRITAPKGVYIDSGNALWMLGRSVRLFAEDEIIEHTRGKVDIRSTAGANPSSGESNTQEYITLSRGGGSLYIRRADLDFAYIGTCATSKNVSTEYEKYTYPSQPWISHITIDNVTGYFDIRIVNPSNAELYDPYTLVVGANCAQCPTDLNSVEQLQSSTVIYPNRPSSSNMKLTSGLKYTANY